MVYFLKAHIANLEEEIKENKEQSYNKIHESDTLNTKLQYLFTFIGFRFPPKSFSMSNTNINDEDQHNEHSTQIFTENQLTQEGTSTVYDKKEEEENSRLTTHNAFSGQVVSYKVDLWNESVTIENVSIY